MITSVINHIFSLTCKNVESPQCKSTEKHILITPAPLNQQYFKDMQHANDYTVKPNKKAKFYHNSLKDFSFPIHVTFVAHRSVYSSFCSMFRGCFNQYYAVCKRIYTKRCSSMACKDVSLLGASK